MLSDLWWLISRADVNLDIEFVRGRVMVLLGQGGGLPSETLAEWAGASPSVVSRVVSSLEPDGWVSKHRSEDDARRVAISLTPAGRCTLAQAQAARLTRIGLLLQATSPRRVGAVRDVTELLANLVRRADKLAWHDDGIRRRSAPAPSTSIAPISPARLG